MSRVLLATLAFWLGIVVGFALDRLVVVIWQTG